MSEHTETKGTKRGNDLEKYAGVAQRNSRDQQCELLGVGGAFVVRSKVRWNNESKADSTAGDAWGTFGDIVHEVHS